MSGELFFLLWGAWRAYLHGEPGYAAIIAGAALSILYPLGKLVALAVRAHRIELP